MLLSLYRLAIESICDSAIRGVRLLDEHPHSIDAAEAGQPLVLGRVFHVINNRNEDFVGGSWLDAQTTMTRDTPARLTERAP
ncbi:hypothetical protein BK671_27660 [Pseudomonas fluorescens]|uniref:Uncharacterized protein n=1 Tax=Pseudomonas fluorescens TaxID=294 RepID=A0A423KUV7_PSEFL|nr:hypothetical protein BK671_27660 [Pseudomonas fluorescens]